MRKSNSTRSVDPISSPPKTVKASDLVLKSPGLANSRRLSSSVVSSGSSLNTKASLSSLTTNDSALPASGSRLSLEPLTIIDDGDQVASPVSKSPDSDSEGEDDFQEALETPSAPVTSIPQTPKASTSSTDSKKAAAIPVLKATNLPSKTLTLKDVAITYEQLIADSKEVHLALDLFLNRSVRTPVAP